MRSEAQICSRLVAGIAGSNQPIPMAARSKTWVYGRSLTGIVGSNPTGKKKSPAQGMVVRLLCLLCVVQVAAPATSLSPVQRES